MLTSANGSSFISVIMPVHNGAAYLSEAIESILSQTFDDFEFIIINDGSTDESADIVKKYADPRILYREQSNVGLAATLNRGIELARGRYVARQDQDDVSLPQRLEKQVNFLEANNEYAMVGTWADIWVGSKRTKRSHRHPVDDLSLRFDLLFNNPFVHSSVMIRKTVLDEIGCYTTDTLRQPPEDYELWSRIARRYKVANIPEVLQIYREVRGSISRKSKKGITNNVVTISRENLSWILQPSDNANDVDELASLYHGAYGGVSDGQRFRELRKLIARAADRLSDLYGVPREALSGRARKHSRTLRNRYLVYKYGRVFPLSRDARKRFGSI